MYTDLILFFSGGHGGCERSPEVWMKNEWKE